jgi:hypothetical protein
VPEELHEPRPLQPNIVWVGWAPLQPFAPDEPQKLLQLAATDEPPEHT